MTAPDFTPAAIQQERERVLGLLSGITQGNWERVGEDICAGHEYKDGKHSAEWIAELCDPADFGDALDDGWRAYSPTNDANAALICAAPDTAHKYAKALAEIQRMQTSVARAHRYINHGHDLLDTLNNLRPHGQNKLNMIDELNKIRIGLNELQNALASAPVEECP